MRGSLCLAPSPELFCVWMRGSLCLMPSHGLFCLFVLSYSDVWVWVSLYHIISYLPIYHTIHTIPCHTIPYHTTPHHITSHHIFPYKPDFFPNERKKKWLDLNGKRCREELGGIERGKILIRYLMWKKIISVNGWMENSNNNVKWNKINYHMIVLLPHFSHACPLLLWLPLKLMADSI